MTAAQKSLNIGRNWIFEKNWIWEDPFYISLTKLRKIEKTHVINCPYLCPMIYQSNQQQNQIHTVKINNEWFANLGLVSARYSLAWKLQKILNVISRKHSTWNVSSGPLNSLVDQIQLQISPHDLQISDRFELSILIICVLEVLTRKKKQKDIREEAYILFLKQVMLKVTITVSFKSSTSHGGRGRGSHISN